MINTIRIGVDFGGVIVKASDRETLLDSNVCLDIQQDDAIKSIKQLIHISQSNFWIISKASKSTRDATRKWLNNVNFYQNTGFHNANLLFCSKRLEKYQLSKPLNLTHFIDDRVDILEHLQGLIPHLYLFGKNDAPDGIVAVKNWQVFFKIVNF